MLRFLPPLRPHAHIGAVYGTYEAFTYKVGCGAARSNPTLTGCAGARPPESALHWEDDHEQRSAVRPLPCGGKPLAVRQDKAIELLLLVCAAPVRASVSVVTGSQRQPRSCARAFALRTQCMLHAAPSAHRSTCAHYHDADICSLRVTSRSLSMKL